MDRLLKMMAKQMLKDLTGNGGDEPHMTEQEKQKKEQVKKEQVKKDLEGFHSLVSAEEHKVVQEVKTALEKLVEVHNRNVYNLMSEDVTSQQAVHYSTFGDVIVEMMGDVECLETIDTVGAEALAEVRIDNDLTYERMAKAKFMDNILKELLGR